LERPNQNKNSLETAGQQDSKRFVTNTKRVSSAVVIIVATAVVVTIVVDCVRVCVRVCVCVHVCMGVCVCVCVLRA
jgi:hypothetical protein